MVPSICCAANTPITTGTSAAILRSMASLCKWKRGCQISAAQIRRCVTGNYFLMEVVKRDSTTPQKLAVGTANGISQCVGVTSLRLVGWIFFRGKWSWEGACMLKTKNENPPQFSFFIFRIRQIYNPLSPLNNLELFPLWIFEACEGSGIWNVK